MHTIQYEKPQDKTPLNPVTTAARILVSRLIALPPAPFTELAREYARRMISTGLSEEQIKAFKFDTAFNEFSYSKLLKLVKNDFLRFLETDPELFTDLTYRVIECERIAEALHAMAERKVSA